MASFNRWLIHIVNIETPTISILNTGEESYAWAVSSADVPCRLVRQTQREPNERLGEMVERSDYVLFKPDVVASTSQRLSNFRLADGTAYDANPWEVDSVLQRNAKSGKHIRLNVHRVD